MRLPHSTPELTASSLPESPAWPQGYTVDRAGALRLRGVAVDDLAVQWGSPLWIVDETEFVRRTKELIQLGATPVFGSGPLCLQIGRWAKSHGWNVWGTPAGLAHAWYLGIKPSRRVTDLRGWLKGADSLPEYTSAVVDLGALELLSLSRGTTGRAYLDVGGVSESALGTALRRLSTESSPLPELAGLVVKLSRDETADEVSSRALHLFEVVSTVVPSRRNLFVDGRNHPDPLPVVAALADMLHNDDGRAPREARLLADVTPGLLRRSSVALARVESVHRTPEGARVGLSGGPPQPWPTQTSVPLVARPSHGTSVAVVRSLDHRLGVLEAPLDVTPGDVIALAGFESAPGLCVILAPDGSSEAVPRADEDTDR